jgi:hypothetical protein
MSEFIAQYWRNRAAATAAMADRRWLDEEQIQAASSRPRIRPARRCCGSSRFTDGSIADMNDKNPTVDELDSPEKLENTNTLRIARKIAEMTGQSVQVWDEQSVIAVVPAPIRQ